MASSKMCPDCLVPPSGTTEPTGCDTGSLFYNTDDGNLKFYDGSNWSAVSEPVEMHLTLPYTTNLVAHYDGDYMLSTSQTDNSQYTSQTNSPATWYDRSGNGNHLTLTNGSGTRWDPDVQNGRGAVWLDTSNTYYTRNVTKNSNDVTSFIVCADSSPSTSSVFAWNDDGPAPYFFNWYNNSTNDGRRWESGTGPLANGTSASGSTGSFLIASGRNSNRTNGFNWRWSGGGGYSYQQNGQNTGTGTQELTIGKYAGYFSGYVCECIVYDSYLSDSDYDTVYNFLRNKWDV